MRHSAGALLSAAKAFQWVPYLLRLKNYWGFPAVALPAAAKKLLRRSAGALTVAAKKLLRRSAGALTPAAKKNCDVQRVLYLLRLKK